MPKLPKPKLDTLALEKWFQKCFRVRPQKPRTERKHVQLKPTRRISLERTYGR